MDKNKIIPIEKYMNKINKTNANDSDFDNSMPDLFGIFNELFRDSDIYTSSTYHGRITLYDSMANILKSNRFNNVSELIEYMIEMGLLGYIISNTDEIYISSRMDISYTYSLIHNLNRILSASDEMSTKCRYVSDNSKKSMTVGKLKKYDIVIDINDARDNTMLNTIKKLKVPSDKLFFGVSLQGKKNLRGH